MGDSTMAVSIAWEFPLVGAGDSTLWKTFAPHQIDHSVPSDLPSLTPFGKQGRRFKSSHSDYLLSMFLIF